MAGDGIGAGAGIAALERAEPPRITARQFRNIDGDIPTSVVVSIYSLVETAKLNGVDPEAWLTDTLARIADHSARHVARTSALELRPAWRDTLTGRLLETSTSAV